MSPNPVRLAPQRILPAARAYMVRCRAGVCLLRRSALRRQGFSRRLNRLRAEDVILTAAPVRINCGKCPSDAAAHDVREWVEGLSSSNLVDKMAHRTFRDQAGLEWQVWDVMPTSAVGVTLDGGWLTFLAGEDKRRLAPVPLYWLHASEAELTVLLQTAKPVGARQQASLPTAEVPAAEGRA